AAKAATNSGQARGRLLTQKATELPANVVIRPRESSFRRDRRTVLDRRRNSPWEAIEISQARSTMMCPVQPTAARPDWRRRFSNSGRLTILEPHARYVVHPWDHLLRGVGWHV